MQKKLSEPLQQMFHVFRYSDQYWFDFNVCRISNPKQLPSIANSFIYSFSDILSSHRLQMQNTTLDLLVLHAFTTKNVYNR